MHREAFEHSVAGTLRQHMTLAAAPEAVRPPNLKPDVFSVYHINIQGYSPRHAAELAAALRLLKSLPDVVCVSESFLDRSTQQVDLEGYSVISRRDRDDGRRCGGVIVWAKDESAACVTQLLISAVAERIWMVIHTDQGPFLLGVWYRPPDPGEVLSIESLEEEWRQLSSGAMGTILMGDMNVHHLQWLRYSTRNSIEGEALRQFCAQNGMKQLVREPTRGPNLLDLLITDIDGVSCKVAPAVADHKAVIAQLKLSVSKSSSVGRTVLNFAAADWDGLRTKVADTSWAWLAEVEPYEGAEQLTNTLLDLAKSCIPQRDMVQRKSTHPWLSERVLSLVRRKHDAAGTTAETETRDLCSQAIFEEFGKFVKKERARLGQVRRGSKDWWSKSSRLMQQRGAVCSIPALKNTEGGWILEAYGEGKSLLHRVLGQVCPH
jgi:hypothetical protein